MGYFVYFFCLLCLTDLTVTMLDSYDVYETLNNFIKTLGSLCSVSLCQLKALNAELVSSFLYSWHVLAFYFFAIWCFEGGNGELGMCRKDTGSCLWERSTNPYKTVSGCKAEMRGSRAEWTENRLEITIMASSTTEVWEMGRLLWIVEYFNVFLPPTGQRASSTGVMRSALDERF